MPQIENRPSVCDFSLLLLEVADVISSSSSPGLFMSLARLFSSRASQFVSRPLDGGVYKAMISFLCLF